MVPYFVFSSEEIKMQEKSEIVSEFKTGVRKPWHTDFNHAICQEEFAGRRPTAVLLVIQDDGVLLVQPTKDPYRHTWVPPQGGITWMDGLIQAVVREAGEELRIPEEHIIKKKMCVLGEYLNPIPKERGKIKNKLLVFIAVPIWGENRILLNEENRKSVWVRSSGHLETVMANAREGKRTATRAAINEAYKRGLLTWSCDQVEQELQVA